MKRLISLWTILTLSSTFSFGQMDQYEYARGIKGISQQWHKIPLEGDIFEKTSQDLRDIRIFGITENTDSIEAPYLLRSTSEKIENKEVAFELLNSSQKVERYYFTFEVPTEAAINQIVLEFEQRNFEWLVNLEGSHNQNEWFSILDSYRILSIKNELTDYAFNKLLFPTSKFRFFRLSVNSREMPRLKKASIAKQDVVEGKFKRHALKNISIEELKRPNRTEVYIELQDAVRASRLDVIVSDTFDYYRPISIQYLSDSFKTEQGMKYIYSNLKSGTMSSLEKNEFKFNSTTVKNLKLIIHNQDNQALNIDSLIVASYYHELLVRFTEPATYFLTYGSTTAQKPDYDIERFRAKIPDELISLELGEEFKIDKSEDSTKNAFFFNKTWLWAIIIIMILLLGWFSLKMIKS